MTIEELRLTMMKSKKTDPEKSKVLANVLSGAQLIAKNDKNREATPEDIVQAAKRELKMASQSVQSGAPYNPETFVVCEAFMPTVLSEGQTRILVQNMVDKLPEKSMKMMGKIMGEISKIPNIDKGLASKIVKELL